jgi:transcription elongation factor Elf1
MDVVYDLKMECLCCGRVGLISSEVWKATEAPAALCISCFQTTPPALVKVIHLMRSQIRMLHEEQQHQARDIKKLYIAQQEMEQDFLGS